MLESQVLSVSWLQWSAVRSPQLRMAGFLRLCCWSYLLLLLPKQGHAGRWRSFPLYVSLTVVRSQMIVVSSQSLYVYYRLKAVKYCLIVLSDNMEVSISNKSETFNVYVSLNIPTDANVPQPDTSAISPGSTSSRYATAATMNMFVWTDINQSPIWSGVIPTKIKKAIEIYPEKPRVLYDGVEIPKGFNPITNMGRPTCGKLQLWNVFMGLILIFIILCVLWYIWKYFSRKS